MKISELFLNPTEIMDPQILSNDTIDNISSADLPKKEKIKRFVSPRSNSNIKKAKQIAHLARIKSRDFAPKNQDDYETD